MRINEYIVNADKPDWEACFLACGKDEPILPNIDLVRMIYNSPDVNFYFLTGRGEICRDLTIDWLQRHGFLKESLLNPNRLMMRPPKCFLPDVDFKLYMLTGLLMSSNGLITMNNLVVIEDNERIVSKVRSAGYTVWDVLNAKY